MWISSIFLQISKRNFLKIQSGKFKSHISFYGNKLRPMQNFEAVFDIVDQNQSSKVEFNEIIVTLMKKEQLLSEKIKQYNGGQLIKIKWKQCLVICKSIEGSRIDYQMIF
ncbi:hypothetical protein IMG5_181230 [Ichthyophthirius multifiliis]|uniref:EF-hand domain-containing protein n=1 Tax=Ichthyophthirius multifiliis TaxID=5932 RepID=G0R2S2_ICHMU|nr:hypothetical protein IMG5_181230 [Ichthyophthirius multifiliis]EGR28194.1 hypothetical protein IMG5_181230 [Ichthyophthirius multifiliis]|eukprot:XP_004027539.1 hypothetical protein IMG5_181230 [Ichthyophthirius multifiliis]